MKSPSQLSWARVGVGCVLALALQHCSFDERQIQDPEQATLNELGTGGSGAAIDGVENGGSTSGVVTTPDGEQGAQPVGLDPTNGGPDDTSSGTDTAGAAAVICAEGSTEQCGPPQEEGGCKFGTRTCSGNAWGECVGAVLPGARDCSSDADNDCDGQPDSTLDDVCRCTVGGTQDCEEHPDQDGKGICRAGTQACVLGAGNATSDWGACSGSVGPGAADSCAVAGDDSNCDGTPNGLCPCVEGAVVPCGPDTDNGICQRGTSTCQNGAFGACQGAVFPARRSCSSALDNDCDGLPDNTPDGTCTCAVGTAQACATHPGRDGNGPCQPGSQTCVASNQGAASSFGACAGSIGPALRDSCTVFGDDSDCSGTANSGCQCVAGRGNQPCAGDPNNSRCNAQGACAPCQANADCSLVSLGRNLCTAGVCSAPRCGDGIVQADRGETCDDSNTVNGDGCSKNCVAGRAPRGGTSFAATHLCGVLPNGSVKCWGLNSSGQVGTGSLDAAGLLAPRTAIAASAVDVAPFGNSTCAALRDGTVSCWGSGFTPTPTVVPGISGVTQLAAGDDAFCGRQTSGRVICWNLGATVISQSAGLGSIVQVANGDRHRCALQSDGALLCSGGNSEGELGRGAIGDRNDTPLRASVFGPVAEVATGYRSTCVRLRTGAVQCLGDGITIGNPTAPAQGDGQPVNVLNVGNAVKVVASEQHLCALTADDAVFCWGSGAGTGVAAGSVAPARITLPRPAIDIGAGSFTSCALLDDSSVYCWGSYTPTTSSTTPVRIVL